MLYLLRIQCTFRFPWLLLILLFFTAEPVTAQRAYWLVPHQASEAGALSDSVKARGYQLRVRSSWLNALSVVLDKQQTEEILTLPFRFDFFPVLSMKGSAMQGSGRIDYSKALEQMQADAFTRRGVGGMGVKIGVTDAGFLYLDDSVKAGDLQHLWKGRQLAGARDFVKNLDTISYRETFYTGRKEPFKERKFWLLNLIRDMRLIYHYHGTEVLRMIAGHDPLPGYRRGLAVEASYYLARTEDGTREFKEEEDYYIAALEWMEKAGVRVVNTSLGYGRGRKLKSSNYKPSDMNGSSMIAKAVEIACTEKNMLVVVAAGNDGAKKNWRLISTPADAASALTVGAVLGHMEKAGYSGIGPGFTPYLKPDVAAYSAQGTSLSAPAVCGFAACLLEMNPALTASELKQIIIRSSHLYPYGNNYIGYGVPLASRAIALMNDPERNFNNAQEVRVNGTSYEPENSLNDCPYVVLFHKSNATHVMRQEVMYRDKKGGEYRITRPAGVQRTTLQAGFAVYELIWE
ncbi:MAG: S8 family serine peptidase [Bacteroidia bacterium]|nr:S8 family serine peptidase [Bacteroidia bacterium]